MKKIKISIKMLEIHNLIHFNNNNNSQKYSKKNRIYKTFLKMDH